MLNFFCRFLLPRRLFSAAVVLVVTGLVFTLFSDAAGAAQSPLATAEPVNVPSSDPEAAQQWLSNLRRDEKGEIPASGLTQALEHVKAMPKASSPSGSGFQPASAGVYPGGWSWLGPANLGGRVRTLVIHPANSNIMWAGAAAGGVWKTTDGGGSWFPLDDFMPNLAVSTIIIDPTNPNILYAGTGEGFFNSDAIQGAGIFKTTNGGQNWSQLANTAPSVSTNFLYVNRLAISPDASAILAATRTGIFRSTDGGQNWTQVLSSGTASVMDIQFDPTPGVAISSRKAIAGGDSGKAWYSTNGGVSWTQATTSGVSTDSRVRIEVAYAARQPAIVYASVNQYYGQYKQYNGEIWKSTNGGQTYTPVNQGNVFLQTQGRYSNALWVDPSDSAGNTLIVGGPYLWRSTDGGVTLTQISQNATGLSTPQLNQHFIVENAGFNGTSNKRVFFTNDGGIYKTDDVYNVIPTQGWQAVNNQLGITQFFGGAGNPATGVILGGSQGQGGLRYSGDANNWSKMQGSGSSTGDNGFVAADPTDPNYFYGEYSQLALYRSSDGGATTSYIFTGITDALSGNTSYLAPFTLDPNNPNLMLAGGQSLWRTTNLKDTIPNWTSIKGSIGSCSGGCISAIAIAKGNSNLIWVGYNNGQVFKTTNGTAASPSWTAVDNNAATNPLPNRTVTHITLDPANPNNVYISFGGYATNNIMHSTDGGTTWADVTGSGASGLPDVPVYTLVQHPNIASWLYAGTDVGIFASEDGGATWKTGPNDGPGNAPVFDMFWLNTSLVIVTHGRGMYRSEIPGNRPLLKAQPASFSDSYGNNNGIIDPGEYISVQIPLRNDGSQSASQINSSLAVTSGNATVLNSAVYPAISSYGGTATASFTIVAGSALSCGEKISFQQTVNYNGSYSYTNNFSFASGLASNGPSTTYTYNGNPVAIPDGDLNGVDIPVTIAAPGQLGKLKVNFSITHPWDGDLALSLIAPDGTTLPLVTNRGGSGANFTATTLDDGATANIYSATAPFSGSFRPEEPLSSLVGVAINGVWKLHIVDGSAGDSGQLNAFSLEVQPVNYQCSAVSAGNPPPVVSALLPASTVVNGPAFTLAVYGDNFVSGSVIQWNGTNLPTTFVNSAELVAQVNATSLTAAGFVGVTVSNQGAGGAVSNSQTFNITAACDPLVVTRTDDSANCGTLRKALTQANSVPNSTISFALALPVTLTISAGPIPALANPTTIKSGCLPGGPGVIIDGNGTSGNGLTINSPVKLSGLWVRNFNGKQLLVSQGQSLQLSCTRTSRN
ncbi:MAG TPA: proprotein convertase P-domain-containing protein [Chloroflexia bacterium]|nr:proprotein convertase P-domain-containing protein [Chloroflexia bacterium]